MFENFDFFLMFFVFKIKNNLKFFYRLKILQVYCFELNEPLPWMDDLNLALGLRRAASLCYDEATKLFLTLEKKKVPIDSK